MAHGGMLLSGRTGCLMAGGKWRENRIGLVVAGLALLAAAPAVTAAAGVQDRWVLAGATAVAAVVVTVGAVWQDRYRRRRSAAMRVGLRTEDGCLVLPDGRMPEVRDITDPVRLGVHMAAPAAVPAEAPGGGDGAGEHVPAYVPRDVDVGCGSVWRRAGSCCWSATPPRARAGPRSRRWPPRCRSPAGLPVEPGRGSGRGNPRGADPACVLWLDDLEGYWNRRADCRPGRPSGHGGGDHRVIIATLRAAEQARLTDAVRRRR